MSLLRRRDAVNCVRTTQRIFVSSQETIYQDLRTTEMHTEAQTNRAANQPR